MKFQIPFSSIYLTAIIIFASCQNDAKNVVPDKALNTIKINAQNIPDFNPSEYVRDIQFINLEVKPGALFSEIDKIKVTNRYIFILDLTGLNHVYVFDLNGRFVRRIGTRGHGPREYNMLNDFDIDDQNNFVYLYDRQHMRMLKYSIDGDLISSKTIPFRADAFQFLENGRILFSVFKDSENTEINSRIVVTDSSFNVLKSFFSYTDDFQEEKGTVGLFTESTQGVLYTKPVNDSLFVFDQKGEILNSYYFDFGEYSVPENLKNHYTKLVEKRSEGRYNYVYTLPFQIKNYIVGNMYLGNTKALFLYEKDKSRFYAKELTGTDLSHKNINLPIGILGDSVIISYIGYDILEVDKDKKILSEKTISHIQQKDGGVVLALYKIK